VSGATPPDRPQDRSSDREELRAEIDRLRLANQELLAEIEDVRSAPRALWWYSRRMWRAAWQRYYIARWHLLHTRDPKRGLRVREKYGPYVARMRHTPLADRRRILHVIGNFHTGGSARLIVDLVEHLGHRFEQKIVVRSLPPTPAYTNVDLIHLERLPSPRALTRILRTVRPELVHVHMLGHQHDDYGKRDWSWYHEAFRAIEAFGVPCIENINIPVEPYVSPSVRCYVHVSDDVKHRFGRLDAWNETIYPGSDLDFFARPDGVPIADDTIGMIYRLQPDKLDERSIEPFIQTVLRRPATRALIVGGGQYLDLYKRRVAEAGVADAFTFTGYVPYVELPSYLARMSVFVAPVHTESFGQVSPFAMGMSIPVVGYDVGALREITDAPELLAPAGDVSALSGIIAGLLDDRAERLRIGARNRERARSRFSVQAMVERYAALYDEILESPGSAAPARAPSSQAPRVTQRSTGSDAPLVSLVMAVRNGERFLRESIQSVLAQSFRGFELLIVDDASTDRTRAIIDSYHDRRIRVITNETQRGLSASLNRGIGAARGRYIARLDADDVAEPERLAAQVELLEQRPEIALAGSWYTIVDEQGREIARRAVPCDHHEIRWMLGFCNAFAHSAVMIRKSALDEVGLYDESLTYAMDYDLWLRIAARMRVANLGRYLVRWRANSASLTAALGDGTERVERTTMDLARRLGWPEHAREENTRRAELLSSIIAGSPADMSLQEAEWATGTLFALLDTYCREHPEAAEYQDALQENLRRHVARVCFWMGHRYPDKRGYAYALGALRLGVRVRRGALFTRDATTLMLKLLGGRLAVSVARSIVPRAAHG